MKTIKVISLLLGTYIFLFSYFYLTPLVFADSIVLTPSTSVYGDLTDPNVNASVTGTHAYRFFNSTGAPIGGNGCAVGTVNDTWSSASVFGGCSGTNTSIDSSNGQAGTVYGVHADYNQSGWAANCSTASTATKALCEASNAYLGDTFTYILTSGGGGGGGGSTTTTATTTEGILGAVSGVGALGLASFISGFFITVWMWKLFLV